MMASNDKIYELLISLNQKIDDQSQKIDMLESKIDRLQPMLNKTEEPVIENVENIIENIEPVIEPVIELRPTTGVVETIKPKKATVTKTKTKKVCTLEYSQILLDFFKSNKVKYDENKTTIENMDKLCKQLNTNIKIIVYDDTVIYQCKTKYQYVKKYKIAGNNIKVCNNAMITAKYDDNSDLDIIEGSTKQEHEFTCELLDIKYSENLYTIINRLIVKNFTNIGLEQMSEAETYVNHYLYRGSTAYLREKNYVLPSNCYSYDINSFHGACLSNFKFPIRQGIAKKITEIDLNVYGLYAIKTTDIKIFVPKSDKNYWYSNEYIKMLVAEGISYTLLDCDDDSYNCIIYNEYDTMSGDTLFYDDIDTLYRHKDNKICKNTITRLFGCMVKNKKIEVTKKISELDTQMLLKLQQSPKAKFTATHVTYLEKTDKFISALGRCKALFYDHCRIMLYKQYLSKYKDNIVRIYTDSFLLSCKLKTKDEHYLTQSMGDIKKELCIRSGVTYPNVQYSFKTNPIYNKTFIYNSNTQKYENIKIDHKKSIDYVDSDEEEEDSDEEDEEEE